MTEEERRQRLLAMGLDPEEYTYQTAEEKAYEDTTALGAVGTGVRSGIGPTLGGIVGAAAPLALGLTGPIGLGVGVLGGIAGGYLGGKGQEAAEDAFKEAKKQGAFVFLNHPAWYVQQPNGTPALSAFQ